MAWEFELWGPLFKVRGGWQAAQGGLGLGGAVGYGCKQIITNRWSRSVPVGGFSAHPPYSTHTHLCWQHVSHHHQPVCIIRVLSSALFLSVNVKVPGWSHDLPHTKWNRGHQVQYDQQEKGRNIHLKSADQHTSDLRIFTYAPVHLCSSARW